MALSERQVMGDRLHAWRRRFQILAYFFHQYRAAYLLIIALSVFVGALESASLALMLPFLQRLLGGASSPLPGMEPVSQMLVRLMPQAPPLLVICLILIVVNLARQLAVLGTEFAITSTTAWAREDIHQRLYRTYADAPYAFFLAHKVGELSHNTTMLTKSLVIALQTGPRFFVDCCRVVAMVALMAWLNPGVTVALVVVGGAVYLPLARVTGRRLYRTGVETRELNTEFTVQLQEFFIGMKQILVANAKAAWLGRLDALNAALRRAYVRETFMPTIPGHLLEALTITMVLGLMIVLHVVDPLRAHDRLAVLGVFGIALLRVMPAFVMLGRHLMTCASFLPDIERLYGLLHEDVPTAPTGRRPVRPLSQGITFDHVTFAYPGREPVLQDLSLEFVQGQFSVVMGLSGAGKSTLMNLILGLYTPTAGRILIDGVDLRELDRSSWYQRIGFVSQDAFLFHASVLENIRLFEPRYGLEEVEQAARISFAHDFILQLPKGYRTVIGERGLRLSGGQQQRLSLARAILRQPDVLLLDEATSALDRESERLVQQAIQTLAQGRAVIAIAHRLSAIQQADQVSVIRHGQLAEVGRHDELLSRSEHYRLLHA